MKTMQDTRGRASRLLRTIRTIGMALTAASASLLAAPVPLPASLTVAAVVIAATAAMLTAICQALYAPKKRKPIKRKSRTAS